MAEQSWRLVLTASPLQGHMSPMLHLATFLHSKGFSITIAHSELNRPDPSNYPAFTFIPLPDNLSSSNTPSFANAVQFMQTLNDNCRPHFQELLVQIQKQKESIVVIHDNLMYFAGSVATHLGLPSIILRTSSASTFPVLKIIPQLHQQGRLPVQDCMLQEIVTELDPLRYKDLPFSGLTVQQTLETINIIMPKKTPSAFIWNTLEFLEPSALTQIHHHYQVPVFPIGPLHKIIPTPSSTSFLEEDTSCISWLDKQAPKSVVYVSLGSIANIDEKISTEMAWGLANSNQPFLWVIRPGSVKGFEWIEFLPEGLVTEMKVRGLIVKWAPQKEVLAHSAVGGFWSHCGWNSTLESLSEGVPMLCQPFELDQKINSRYVCFVWKMGVEIFVERGEIEGAIRRVLVGKEGEEMKQKAKEIQGKVKVAVSHRGSSQNSLKKLVDFILSL
ncbi:putative UDP-glucuronosyl/UDP-glucosyltransferase [Helianthus annuus]|uniref:UDP-glucuronosyl/UDP-glucosyltransferase n=1 Tax=Helianthus annuus TaxID=4232 RepID=A0A251TAD9_HELAN|nr:UDP-glycosyltransferase 76H1 [Helianthus annuus]KAF5782190.1 putative UDP-glucuronosyl/UDP-glucosyltransferase [Helianthus annuus]KAJ0501701.1 putative UDP-glucuronosyl/UDP-glucosyltransferase [Helianthus annuus]KAJ0509576.1 putative UDP-glucuronosyl/UDP-glucosyltransferase [Helianthus annuus]KAJ0517614.1 putative UDP-glucuronosyl/UDP-glucosyltransferase [Helianthus annuus]KAJ0685627.1 putative UDP-glucuronosyl/UDP-glucosyltransferase [Helianthus annuus]